MTMAKNSSASGVVYWALNGYGVTGFEIAVNVILVIMAVWIIVLNSLVIDTLVRIKKKRGSAVEPADWLVSSLSLADLVNGFFLIYNSVYNLTNFQIRVECSVRNALLLVALFSSVFHLGVLTADRYTKIIAPYRYNTVCNGTTVLIMTVAVWIVSVLIALLPITVWTYHVTGKDKNGDDIPVCSFFGILHPDYLRLSVCLYLIPCIVMLILYAHIFKLSWFHPGTEGVKVASRHARAIAVQEGARARERHSWKYTKTVVLIMGLYFVAWLPGGILIILHVEGYLDDYALAERGVLLTYCSIFIFANSLTNPVIYAVKITAVRVRFQSLFCRRTRQVHCESSVTHVVVTRGDVTLQQGACQTGNGNSGKGFGAMANNNEELVSAYSSR